MESKKINQLATELTPALDDLTIIGDPTTGISKKITLSQMASLFTGTVEEYANLAAFPLVGTADTIYIALDTNIIYRWNTGTSAYVELSPNIVTSLVFSDANGFDGTISLVGSTATLTITTALTQGSVPFIGASGALSQDNANLFFDDTNNRLGVNTNVPTTALDVFGSGIIGRLNGTSTNNAFLGFASAGSNKWSIGNVQSDHRFRIYNEATTSELVSVLQTGEFGIGIANPLTKLHIFGGASALIANLDANTSVAKSISFRSGNSSRINLEVSGTESGSNAGADLFIRRYSDAGSLIDTPFFIKRSTGNIGINTNSTSYTLDILSTQSNTLRLLQNINGDNYININNTSTGTSATSRMDIGVNSGSYALTIQKYGLNFSGTLFGVSCTNSSAIYDNSASSNGLFIGAVSSTPIIFGTNNTERMRINSNGNAEFTGQIKTTYSGQSISINAAGTGSVRMQLQNNSIGNSGVCVESSTGGDQFSGTSAYSMAIGTFTARDLFLGTNSVQRLSITSTGDVGIGIAGPYGRFHVAGGDMYLGLYHATNKFCLGGDANQYIRYASFDGLEISGYQGVRFSILGGSEVSRYTAGGYFKASNDGTYINATGPYHEMRTTSSNNEIVVLRNTSASPYGCTLQFSGASPNNTTNWIMYCEDSTAQRFSVRSNGGIHNYQANNVNLSDERTKKDITPLESYWNKFKAIEIVKFKYKDQTHDDFNIGVIAQQVESIAPEFIDVDGWGNKPKLDEEGNEIINEEEPLKSVYTSDLHHATIKVLQEAMAKIETLEEKVKQLESK